jgi:hypothetical protein
MLALTPTPQAGAASAPLPAFFPYDSYGTGSRPESVVIADVTGDGLEDVILNTTKAVTVADPDNDYKLFVFPQQPDGSLGTPVESATSGGGPHPGTLAVGDLDGDSQTDVALATPAGVDLFYQGEDGLLPKTTLATTSIALQVELGDAEGDGDLDLFAVLYEDTHLGGKVVWFANQGEGGFGSQRLISNTGTREIELGDLSGDGRLDVATSSRQIFPGQAGGTFGPAIPYSPSGIYGPHGIAIADVTGDERADLILTISGNRPDTQINVLAQDETGRLAPAVAYPSYDSSEAVEALDMSGDGLVDVVVGHGSWERVGVYKQTSEGALEEEALYTTPLAQHPNVKSLALGDINNDDRPDIVLARWGAPGELVVLRQGKGASLSLTPTRRKVSYGSAIGLTAHLEAGDSVNHDLSIWMRPVADPDGPPTLLLEGSVDASGDLAHDLAPAENTGFWAEWDGDGEYAPLSTRLETVFVRVVTTGKLGRHYDTSGKYKLFHQGTTPRYTITVTPNHYNAPGDADEVHLKVQRYRDGRWRPVWGDTLNFAATGKATGYISKDVLRIGPRYRVRGEMWDHVDHAGDVSPWSYFKLTR